MLIEADNKLGQTMQFIVTVRAVSKTTGVAVIDADALAVQMMSAVNNLFGASFGVELKADAVFLETDYPTPNPETL